MFKKLLIFSTIAVLGGCETINQASQCDPDKNYIISNPQAMEEYQKLKLEGDVKSVYLYTINPEPCNDISCVYFYSDKYDFMERYFNDDYRKGVYTIKFVENGKACIKSNSASQSRFKNVCLEVTKNENDLVKSKYQYVFDNTDANSRVITFKDVENKEDLFKYSYQVYSTGAIGGPGFGKCPQSYINHPEYKFNPNAFP